MLLTEELLSGCLVAKCGMCSQVLEPYCVGNLVGREVEFFNQPPNPFSFIYDPFYRCPSVPLERFGVLSFGISNVSHLCKVTVNVNMLGNIVWMSAHVLLWDGYGPSLKVCQ